MKIVGFWYSEKTNNAIKHVKEHKKEYIVNSIRLALLMVVIINNPSIVAFKPDSMVQLVGGFYNAVP